MFVMELFDRSSCATRHEKEKNPMRIIKESQECFQADSASREICRICSPLTRNVLGFSLKIGSLVIINTMCEQGEELLFGTFGLLKDELFMFIDTIARVDTL